MARLLTPPDAEAELRAALAESRAVFDACFAKGGDFRQGDLFQRSADAMLGGRRALRLAQIVEYMLTTTLTAAPAADADDEDGRVLDVSPHPPRRSPNGCRGASRPACATEARQLDFRRCCRGAARAVLELPSLPEPGTPVTTKGRHASADVPHVRRLSSADLDVADDGDGNAAVLPVERVTRNRRRARRASAALLAHAKLVSSRLEPLSLLAQAADEKTREARATIDQL